ncbi:hypothetical protein B0H17DRAFT_1207280 [Mycena rosella]|uniref:Uncharacterized protein n=1 Tax=Mycena rosella TaxID=1033263 RepID=A0AAD7G8B9_MYCRO|nr:hypothetical protein B0H17DRAFT_1207280 [Mycena rosella]
MRFQFAFVALAISSVSAVPVARSIFDKTSTITSTKHINAPVEDDDKPESLVTSSVPDPTDPNTITVTDKLPLFLACPSRRREFLLSPIVTDELQTSHNQLMDTLASQLETAAAAPPPA